MKPDIYAKAVRVLPSNTNDPEHGNNPTLAARPGAKPVIVCGDGMFQWFDADQEPEPGVGKIQDQPYFQRKAQQGVNLAGALYFQGRFSWNTRRVNSMGVCIGNRQAVISAHDDLIIICDAMLDPAGKARTSPSPSAFKASVSAGTDLREGLVSFPTQLWHELGHWFGGVTPQLEHSELPFQIHEHLEISSITDEETRSLCVRLDRLLTCLLYLLCFDHESFYLRQPIHVSHLQVHYLTFSSHPRPSCR